MYALLPSSTLDKLHVHSILAFPNFSVFFLGGGGDIEKLNFSPCYLAIREQTH
jgi:hypothetical protein